MPEQSRPITDMDLLTQLPKLFDALPPRKGNVSDFADAYKMALSGNSHEALAVAVLRYVRGEIEGQSLSYAPAPPELARTVRDIDAKIRRVWRDLNPPAPALPPPPRQESISGFTTMLNQEFQAWNNGAAPGPLMLEAWRKYGPGPAPRYYERREFLCDAPTAKAAEKMAKRGAVPVGSLYVARFAAFYSPAPAKPDNQEETPDAN